MARFRSRSNKFPLLHEVTLIRRVRQMELDELNNEVWVDEEFPEAVLVAGWSVPSADEPKLAGHDRRTVDVELLAPVGVFRLEDAVKLPDREDTLEVVGEPENYSHGPFGWDPGLEVVNLGGVS
ncbi:hypothetical protein [Corynebacterium callunae]|nr:hypothetical protein [Corynebacterium callunae]MCK2200183.1 hypothetical protein [Corynebacterium callunae]